jgi:hypothetical protein
MVTFRASVEAPQDDPVMDLTMCLLNSVTTAHILHLSTKSYSQHFALGKFYNEIGELVDAFVEAFQGKYGVLTKYPTTCDLMPTADPLVYMDYLKTEVATLRVMQKFPQDSELQNEVDNIANLINSTIFLLRLK